jgi:protein-L-isoaspartate(D-aspartate) O-methyltransferase
MNSATLAGIGMTSQRTRARMVERLRDPGHQRQPGAACDGPGAAACVHRAGTGESRLRRHRAALGFGQTISQPFVVARMIEILIAGRELGKTLEIGAGCGYQAAILGVLSKQVFAVERIAPLLARARENLKQIRLSHIRLKHADGNLGLPEAAPFDTIILAAAAAAVPQTLLAQLAPGGRLAMPLGTTDQVISLVERTDNGFVETRFDAVRFVPLLPGVE